MGGTIPLQSWEVNFIFIPFFLYEILLNQIDSFLKGESILGWTTRNHLKEWLKNKKHTNHFHGPLL